MSVPNTTWFVAETGCGCGVGGGDTALRKGTRIDDGSWARRRTRWAVAATAAAAAATAAPLSHHEMHDGGPCRCCRWLYLRKVNPSFLDLCRGRCRVNTYVEPFFFFFLERTFEGAVEFFYLQLLACPKRTPGPSIHMPRRVPACFGIYRFRWEFFCHRIVLGGIYRFRERLAGLHTRINPVPRSVKRSGKRHH